MENGGVQCKFKLSKHFSDRPPAFLVDFSNGQIKSDSSRNIEFRSYCRDVNVRNDRFLIAETGRLVYKSESMDNNGYKLPIRYVVGVFNKKSNKMKLYDCSFFHLKPIYKLHAIEDKPPDNTTRKEQVESLALNFGNKSKKRAITARAKYSVDASQMPNAFESLNLEPESPSTLDKSGSASEIDYLPPQNKDAQDRSEVYNIGDIISEEEDYVLEELADNLLNEYPSCIAKWKEDGTYCKYVIYHLERCAVNKEKAKYLIYYNYYVMLSKLVYKDMKRKDPLPDIPEPFKSKLLEKFTILSGKSRSFNQKMKDKVFAYLFVLALIIDDFLVNISMILGDVKKGLTAAANVAQALGCHVVQRKVENSAVKFAELKLPLFVMTTKYSKKKTY